jgi:hypothetical protein
MTLPKTTINIEEIKQNKDLHIKIRVTENDKKMLDAVKDYYSLTGSEFFRTILKEHFEIIQEEKII